MYLVNLIKAIFTWENIFRCVVFACIPAGLFYIISVLVMKTAGFDLIQILRDPAQQTETSSFLGFLSNIGNWVWVSSAAICLFSAINVGSPGTARRRELALMVGVLSLALGIDDFFLIHDRFIHEYILYGAYAVLALALMARHYRQIVEIDGFSFLLAGGFLALSIFTDLIQESIPVRYGISQLAEEGFKFLGATTWLYFSVRMGLSFQPFLTRKA
ncbi:hypothetical protein [Sneathiella sp.]|uniref:hypothetical protein n=1 Tax=Sneathiella sp. TaxID=1964365 RepID=UPI0025FAEE22|nr:hypothetical protein [Sneathiella sp.]